MRINNTKYIFKCDNDTIALYNAEGVRYFTFSTSQ